MREAILVLWLASGLDWLAGDPVYRLHPVRLIGGLATRMETALRRAGLTGLGGGTLLTAVVPTVALGLYAVLRAGAWGLMPRAAVLLDIYVLYSCIALRDMTRHARPIAAALRRGADADARDGLQRIVGRDVRGLDAAGIARGAVESVAESFVDGFLAPVCWFTIAAWIGHRIAGAALPAGVAAALAYRCVNTLDSMIGYRNERYLFFGRTAARADDLLSFLPARLSLGLLWLAAVLLRLDAGAGWRTARRDRLKHASPNSAHAESFAAGALHIRLGGPTVYAHGVVDKPWLGDGSETVGPQHIGQVCRLTLATGIVTALIAGLLLELAP